MKKTLASIVVITIVSIATLVFSTTKIGTFFRGKTVNFIIPYSPGGGYDLYARMVIPTFGKHLGAYFIANNVPGGGALIGTNTLYKAKPDGLTMGILNGTGMTLSELTGQKGVQFEMRQFTYLGRLSTDEEFLFMGAKSPYRTLDALLKARDRETKWVTEGRAGSPYYRVALTCELLKLHKAKILTGYPGSAEANLAIIRGDADGTAGTYSSRQAQVDSGEFIPVLILGKKRSKDFPQVPTIYEVPGLTAEDRKIADFLVGLDQLGRIVACPPKMEREKAIFLREVFKKVCLDPSLLARAKKEKRIIDYATPEEVERMINDVLMAPSEIKKRIEAALKRFE